MATIHYGCYYNYYITIIIIIIIIIFFSYKIVVWSFCFLFDKYLWFLKLLHFRKENKRPTHVMLIDGQRKNRT
jgi:hypothetical protein